MSDDVWVVRDPLRKRLESVFRGLEVHGVGLVSPTPLTRTREGPSVRSRREGGRRVSLLGKSHPGRDGGRREWTPPSDSQTCLQVFNLPHPLPRVIHGVFIGERRDPSYGSTSRISLGEGTNGVIESLTRSEHLNGFLRVVGVRMGSIGVPLG